jgi:DNA processing protein
LSTKSYGTNRLIQEGAKLVTSVEDIIVELRPQLSHLISMVKPRKPQDILTDFERNMLESLSNEPLHIDKIAQMHSLPTSHTLTLLLSLELKDYVKQLAGKMFIRI